jgi:hypothetical protein
MWLEARKVCEKLVMAASSKSGTDFSIAAIMKGGGQASSRGDREKSASKLKIPSAFFRDSKLECSWWVWFAQKRAGFSNLVLTAIKKLFFFSLLCLSPFVFVIINLLERNLFADSFVIAHFLEPTSWLTSMV